MTTTESTYETRYAEYRERALAWGVEDGYDLHAEAERYALDTRRTANPHRDIADGKLACRSCGEWDGIRHETGCDLAERERAMLVKRLRRAARVRGEHIVVRRDGEVWAVCAETRQPHGEAPSLDAAMRRYGILPV